MPSSSGPAVTHPAACPGPVTTEPGTLDQSSGPPLPAVVQRCKRCEWARWDAASPADVLTLMGQERDPP